MPVLVSLTDLRAFLRVSGTGQDALLTILGDDAEDWLQRMLGVKFASASRTETVDGGGRALRPTMRPVTAITSVTDEVSGLVETSTNYELVSDDDCIYRTDRSRWSSGRRRYTVVYTGGFATADIPGCASTAVLQLVYRMYDNRGGKGMEIAAGWHGDWQGLMTSDLWELLKPIKRTTLV